MTHIKSALTIVASDETEKSSSENSDSNQSPLTKREVEILRWLSEGKSSLEISIILNICESTVKFHVNNTLAKLHASNRTHAVAKALRQQLI